MDNMQLNLTCRSLGANIIEGKTYVTVWAPLRESLHLVLENGQVEAMGKDEQGIWTTKSIALPAGQRYKLSVEESEPLPDPCSLSQPDGVHGYSEVIDLNKHDWGDSTWQNPVLASYILYELHVGTFTPEGTFDAIVQKLDYLVELGINAIELMPVAQFPGERNWGYDGVFPYAVQNSYGGPYALQRLVDACHQKGIAVVLDVVYNHLGPEGNYLGAYGPYFTDKYHTPWGEAINVDDTYSDGVRQFIIENMLMWFRDFHIDALRLDAVHALKDFGAKQILAAMREASDKLSQQTGRHHYLIGECDLNDVRYIREEKNGGYGLHGQWIDEFHHALRVSVGEPKTGYYADFESITHLSKSYAHAYVYNGIYSPHRKKTFGNEALGAKGEQFVVFSQNHDQVGNRMLGERSSQLYSLALQQLMATAVLAAPYLPMLFMGEEYGEKQPFQYFVSHTDEELAEAVRKGRREEFKDFHGEEEAPDPMAVDTFTRSKLNWRLLESEQHNTLLQFYKKLIALRKKHSAWHTLDRTCVQAVSLPHQQSLILHRWDDSESLFFFFNFGRQGQRLPLDADGPLVKIFYTEQGQFNGAHQQHDQQTEGMVFLPAESVAIFQTTIV